MLRYKNGLELMVHCAQCGHKVKGKIYQQRIRWIARLDCPHGKKHMGYTMPQDEIIKKQLASTNNSKNDPRVIEAREHATNERELEEKEIRAFAKRGQEYTNRRFM